MCGTATQQAQVRAVCWPRVAEAPPVSPPPQTVSLSCFTASKDVRQLLLGMDFYLHTMQAHHESVICKNVGSRIFQMLRHFIKITFVKIATNLVRGHH